MERMLARKKKAKKMLLKLALYKHSLNIIEILIIRVAPRVMSLKKMKMMDTLMVKELVAKHNESIIDHLNYCMCVCMCNKFAYKILFSHSK